MTGREAAIGKMDAGEVFRVWDACSILVNAAEICPDLMPGTMRDELENLRDATESDLERIRPYKQNGSARENVSLGNGSSDPRTWVKAAEVISGRITMDSAQEHRITDENFLTVAEIAIIMRVSKTTVYRMAQSGELESIRFGRSLRIPERAAKDHIEKGRYGRSAAR